MYNRIEKICKERGTTITAVCTLVTGSSGNLSTWKKGYMRSDYLLKVSEHLNVSTDYLLTGKERHISEDKESLLNNYDKLDEIDQKRILKIINAFLDDYTNKNDIFIDTAARTEIENLKKAKPQKY